MQGKLVIAILVAVATPSGAFAGGLAKRVLCPKAEQAQQRSQQAKEQQRRSKSQGCPVQRQVPPVIDPTPHFFL